MRACILLWQYLIQRLLDSNTNVPKVSSEFYASFSHRNLLWKWSPTSLRAIYVLKVVGMNGAISVNVLNLFSSGTFHWKLSCSFNINICTQVCPSSSGCRLLPTSQLCWFAHLGWLSAPHLKCLVSIGQHLPGVEVRFWNQLSISEKRLLMLSNSPLRLYEFFGEWTCLENCQWLKCYFLALHRSLFYSYKENIHFSHVQCMI